MSTQGDAQFDRDSGEVEPGSIAIVGMAGRFPSASTPAQLWELLKGGREATQWLSDDELLAAGVPAQELADPAYVRASLVLPDMEMFDAGFFGFSKRDASVLDPQHRHFLECAWEALEDAGHMPENFKGAIGVFGGCGMQAYLPFNLLSNPELVKSMGMFLLRHTGNDKDFLCSRVSYLLDLKGPSISVQTACSTSLVAVHMAAQSLLSGECDMALAGGASIELPHRRGYRFAPGEIMSPDGHCRAFDDDAAGTIFGSGAALVVLRRLEDALRDGDNIHAVIRGSAVNNDGSGKAGYFAPSVDGQARAAVEALGVAGVDPASVSYVEAHGTGTPVGDPIEIAALSQAYGSSGDRGFCGIGSIKTNIGHLDTAAGVASLIKVAMALRNGVIPASLNFSKPNSRLELASTPFHVVAQARPWPRSQSPRIAGVNSLGVGGTNAHVIVQEAPLLPAQQPAAGCHVVTLSARTAASLERLKSRWAAFLGSAPADFSLANAAFTTQVGRRAFEHRCAIAAADVDELRRALEAPSHPRCASGTAAAQSPPVVMMFPGGGAHYPGAGRELLKHTAFREAVDACLLALPVQAPRDLRAVMFEAAAGDAGAAQRLEKPRYAMPALFTLEYALAQLWASWGIRPAAVIGHSAGEYAAAVIAGVLSVADALTLVCLRGQLFEQTAPGSMLAVDLPPRDLEALMRGIDLDIAAINAPDLCIASGSLEAIAQLEQRLAAQGLEGRRLHINVAAHSRLLDDVLDTFREGLSRIRLRPPQLPFISNLTGDWADPSVLTSTDYWVRHLRNPVRFADGLQRALELPGAVLLEVGPGQGLGALARQNAPQAGRTILASTCRANEPGGDLAWMMASAGALWTRGLAPDWSAMRGRGPHRRISLPTYAFDHERHWVEPGVQADAVPASSPVVTAVTERKLRAPTVERLAAHDDWFSVPQWTPLAPVTPARVTPGQWLVFGNRSQLTADVVARAASGGSPAILVCRGPDFARLGDGSYTIAPGQPEHYTRLLHELEQAGFLPDHIVHLWSLDTMPGAGSRQVADQTLAFDSLVAIARSVQELDATKDIRLTIVTAGSQSVHGEALPHPERALAIGPCRVIPHEIPNVRTRLVDLASIGAQPAGLAQSIVHEAMQADEADMVALRGDARWTLRLVPAPASPDSNRPRVRQGGVYLITGGLGDIALDLAAFLASGFQARLALVSRRSLPARASWRGLAASGDHSAQVRLVRRLVALEDAGAQVLTFSADVADPQAMARVVGECRARLGAINGVFHTAGALGDGLIGLKTAESIEHVMRAKVRGGQVLHELLPAGDLDVFAVFSSTSVFLGAAGQVDYVAANAFLDALAASRSDGLCIRWGIWGDRGMAALTYGKLGNAPEAQQGVHPLLGAQIDAESGASFEAVYSSRDLWVLREHALAGHPGHPVLPGTAYIEIAHAAMMVLHPRAAVEIRSLSFEEAMVFDAQAPRLVRVEMRQNSAGYDFVVRSRAMSDERWLEHARARVGVFHGRLAAAAVPSQAAWLPGAIPQERSVDFGPRWRNIARMQLGERIATAELQLPAQYASDLSEYAMHPAVVDMAATFGLHLVDDSERRQNLFVPLSVERIRIAGKVPLRCVSQALLKDPVRDRFVAFDIGLYAPDGTPLATFEGFSLRGVQPQVVAQHGATHHQPTLVDEMLACGIRGEDSQALFSRIIGAGLRDVVVSSIDLQRLRSAMQGATPASPVRRPTTPRAGTGTATASAAFNRVERVIAQAWCELLGVETVRPDDDFFALGGHSLAAVRLFAQIRKHFNVDLPLATLFQAPTLASLSALVAQTGGIDTTTDTCIDASIETADAAKGPDAAHPTSNTAGAQPGLRKASSNVVALLARAWSPLIAINRGEAGRTPLFCVHGAGGNVLNFKVISDRLGPAQPFYGLQAQGVDGRMPPLATIEEMAAQYVEAVRGVDARGPYRLAGYSAGGMIALEMAHQMRKAGAQVELLVMIDTLSPAASRRKVSVFQKLWLMRRWSLQFALEWPGRRRRNKQAEASYAQALERLARGEPLPPELVEFHLFRNFMNAQSQYWPQPYDGDVALFKARESDTQYLGAGDKLGWDEHVTGDIRVVEIQGSHFSMMAEPGVTELTHALRIELESTPSGKRLAESYKSGAIAPTKHSQLPS